MEGIDITQPIFGSSLPDWLSEYGYFILLPLMALEGRVVGLIAAALAHLGYLNIYLVWVTAIVAGLISDATYYSIGRWSTGFLGRFRVVERAMHRFRHSPTGTVTREFVERRGVNIFFFTKAVPSVSWTLQLIAGGYRLDAKKYFTVCFVANIFWGTLTMVTGYFMGYLTQEINTYLVILIGIILVAALYYIGRRFSAKLSQES